VTTPPQQPQPQPQPQPQQDAPSDAALIAALIAAFLALYTVKAITDRLRKLFSRAGVSSSALKAGVAVVLSMPQQPMEGTGPATRWSVSQNEIRRAAFTLASVRRIQRAADEAKAQGQPVIDAIMRQVQAERRYLGQHVEATNGRLQSASAVDGMAYLHGPVLSWNAVKDARCTPGCRLADGKNFRADRPPIVEGHPAYPGSVHGATCRCTAGPPRRGAAMLPSS
jgi:hypothetical protein